MADAATVSDSDSPTPPPPSSSTALTMMSDSDSPSPPSAAALPHDEHASSSTSPPSTAATTSSSYSPSSSSPSSSSSCASPASSASPAAALVDDESLPGLVFKRYYLQCMQQASYLVGDSTSGCAFVIDPRRDADQYLRDCTEYGLKLKGVLETHVHADFVSGHKELSEATGARVYIGERNRVCYDHVEAKDGLTLRISDAYAFRAMETPGHTLGCVSWVLEHAERGAVKVFTGDTLFAGSVGMPDLCGSCASMCRKPQEMAAMLYESLWEKLLKLPPSVEVNPTHKDPLSCPEVASASATSTSASATADVSATSTADDNPSSPDADADAASAVSDPSPTATATSKPAAEPRDQRAVASSRPHAAASRPRGRELWTTIGHELATNPALQCKSKADFVDYITCRCSAQRPQYCPIAADMNKFGAECVGAYVKSVPKLPVADFSDIATMNRCMFVIIDGRDAEEYAAGHIPLSLNFPLTNGKSSGGALRAEDGNFAIWIGTVLPPDTPLLVVAPTSKCDEMLLRIARIGYQNVLGVLAGGFAAWRDSGRQVGVAELVKDVGVAATNAPPPAADERGARLFLDVRTETEFRGCSGFVRHAIHVPLSQLPRRYAELCKTPEYVVYCSGGYRAAIAASLMRREGFRARSVDGGFDLNLLPNHPELITYEEHNDFAY